MASESVSVPGVPAAALSERFVRASGPGGQNVNKVSTAVELRCDLARVSWPEVVKARLRRLAGSRLIEGDVVVVEAREHRTQSANREAARERLAALVAQAFVSPRTRRPSRPTKASRERRLDEKTRRSTVKRDRRSGRGDD